MTPAEQEARAWAEGVAAKLSDCNWDKDVEATFATTLAEHVLPLIQAKEEAEQEAIELGKAGDRATTEWHEALERERPSWGIADALAEALSFARDELVELHAQELGCPRCRDDGQCPSVDDMDAALALHAEGKKER